MPERAFTDAELDAAVDALSDPERFTAATALIQQAAPQLQKLLAIALKEGGWFDATHEHAVQVASLTDDPQERVAAVRTLLAEEARLGMMVGVAVGYELARELETDHDEGGT
ncbi:MAG TPA: hypothetical protein VF066_02175 [Thermoleophilaceae bacterium]